MATQQDPDSTISLLLALGSMLNKRQKEILTKINCGSECTTVTEFISCASAEMSASRTSLWYNARCLKKSGLIDFGSQADKGRPIILTQAGKRLAEVLK